MSDATPGSPATGDAGSTAETRRRPRARRLLLIALSVVVGLLLAGIIGILIWSQVGVMSAEPGPLDDVRSDDRVAMSEVDGSIVITPAAETSGVGLVFVPGAKVEAEAYAAILAGVVADEGVTVVITRPSLNLAFFDPRPLTSFTDLVPDVSTWLVGGHSLGGVRACQLAPDADGLVLFASYCANDLAEADLPVLSLSGSEDGLTTPQKVDDNRGLLPADAALIEIPGASHASFGDYGPQAGDGTPTISDADMRADVTAALADLVATLPR
ncbi:alpha/beta hydrolase [Microbacterium thalli]|uniref:Alpha/beta hydrolase n=1 Tax=Microbacterium thalli TaxID=3027921 RepID=A0ABT5SHD0_9MICO|nr:alpha/beta hydrolase [Microbacterium thalli]MDD7962121.1 alpha/beta hydrolase [Microbacterium thalli]MDN8548804.1 alpha/beta hydrolase [Microbacterium thalli]